MANKNKAGNAYHYSMKKIDRIVKEIDKRSKNGEDRKNVAPAWQKHKITAQGKRVWSF